MGVSDNLEMTCKREPRQHLARRRRTAAASPASINDQLNFALIQLPPHTHIVGSIAVYVAHHQDLADLGEDAAAANVSP